MSEQIPYALLPSMSGGDRGGGRKKNAGLSILEVVNQYADAGLVEAELRKIARNKAEPWVRRTAAERALRTMESPDMADFEPVLDGQSSLRELRCQGIATDVIKKTKTKRRMIPNGDNPPIEEVEREIELHDRSGDEFDRVMDRTHGKPAQEIQVTQSVEIRSIHISYSGGHENDQTPEIATNSQMGEISAALESHGATGGSADGD